jgi:protein SCO1
MRQLLGFVLLLAACSQPRPLPIYGQVPDFQLTAQTGKPFGRADVDGRIWVADFIYTTCDGPCPLMTSKMHRVQGSAPEILYVSFSVDPEHDTPEALEAYARKFKTKPDWVFLTGSRGTLQMLSRDAFKLSDLGLTHSTRFVLVDRKCRIRGYYGTSDDSAIPQLLADIRRLEKEPS